MFLKAEERRLAALKQALVLKSDFNRQALGYEVERIGLNFRVFKIGWLLAQGALGLLSGKKGEGGARR